MATAAGEGLRALWVLFLVLATATLMLAGLDAVPTWLHGEPRGVRRVASIEEVERRLNARVLLPAYFPDAFRWPPATVRMTSEDGGAVSLAFLSREGVPALILAQGLGGTGPLPASILAEGAVLARQRTGLGEGATLSRVVGEDGTMWNELEWTAGGRRHVLRGKGSLEEMLRMARSVHGSTGSARGAPR